MIGVFHISERKILDQVSKVIKAISFPPEILKSLVEELKRYSVEESQYQKQELIKLNEKLIQTN